MKSSASAEATAGFTDGSNSDIDSGSGAKCNTDNVGEENIFLLQPGRLIRPMISVKVASQLVQNLYGLTAKSVKEMNSYDDRNFFVSVEQDPKHNNHFIEEISPQGYVLKILNSMDSRKHHHIDAEHKVQGLLTRHGIDCPQPVLNVNGQDKSLEEIVYDLPETGSDERGFHIVRLLTFVPGQLLFEAHYTERLLYRVGQYVASVQKALEGFCHPSLNNHQSIWSLDSIPELFKFTSAVQDTRNRRLVEDVIGAFQTQVIPNTGQFQKGIIHGDINEQNILVKHLAVPYKDSASANSSRNDQPTEFDICGILDFGDVANSYYIYEVAIAIMYMMLDSKIVDLLDVGGHVLAGYSSSSERGLNEVEFKALRVCVAARYAQSLTMGAYTYSVNPTNEYLLTSARNGWMQLSRLWNTPSAELYKRWTDILKKYADCKTNPLVMHSCASGNTTHTP